MWADAERMRALTRLVLGSSALWIVWSGINYAVHLPVFALRTVELTHAPGQVTAAQLRAVVSRIEGNFFTVDLQRARQALEQLPWVRGVNVRRKFPWALEIELEEHVALARWNQRDLVNTHGEVFHAESSLRLPEFSGAAQHARLVTETYGEINRLLAPLQRRVARITLSQRMAWEIDLDNGLQLALGREGLSERLLRFVRAYPSSLAAMPGARRIDLRYRDGFAVANG